jgi:hypothetical protein
MPKRFTTSVLNSAEQENGTAMRDINFLTEKNAKPIWHPMV